MKSIALTAFLMVSALQGAPASGRGSSQTLLPEVHSSAAVPAAEAVRFEFEEVGLVVPHWQIDIHADGRGSYSEKVEPAPAGKASELEPITVSNKTMTILLAGAGRFSASKRCETKAKNLAQTGKKTLSYTREGPPSTCEFNYSDDETLMHVVGAFQGIADTMQYGPRLAHLHRFDRLGLDVEVAHLVDAVKDGRAIEVQNIAPVLQSIVDDERVIDRVRRKAARLLQDAGSAGPMPESAR